MKKFILMLVLISSSAFAVERNFEEYNPEHVEIGLQGWDPVSFFREGPNEEIGPQEGSELISIDYEGLTYRFATEENREEFLSNPERYEMTYGGWCAWAMVSNGRQRIDVRWYSFDDEVEKNRIHFFVSERARDNFNGIRRGNKRPGVTQRNEDRADDFWEVASGELPRGKNR